MTMRQALAYVAFGLVMIGLFRTAMLLWLSALRVPINKIPYPLIYLMPSATVDCLTHDLARPLHIRIGLPNLIGAVPFSRPASLNGPSVDIILLRRGLDLLLISRVSIPLRTCMFLP